MSRPASNRFYLADLVMAALMCGLVMALITSARSQVNAGLVFFLICVVASIWSVSRAGRKAPTCEECGRRFIEPDKAVALPDACPHCGRGQLAGKRSVRRVSKILWGLLGLLVVLVAVAAVMITLFNGGSHEAIAIFAGIAVLGGGAPSLLAILVLVIYRLRPWRPEERLCEACGWIIPAKAPGGPKICPQCRVRHLRTDEAKKQRSRDQRVSLGFLALLAILAAFLFPRPSGSGTVMGSWIGFSLLVLGMLAAMFGALVAWSVFLQLRRRRQLRSESGALAMAQESAGRDGEVVKDGPWTIWYTGPDDPVPMLRGQMAAACRRFAALTGAADVAEPSLRLFVFHDRAAFVRFHRQLVAGIDLTTLDGLQLGNPYRLLTLCTAPAACRITDPERTIRLLAAYVLLESAWGSTPPAWLQSGLSRSVDLGGGRDERARLNRKMIASLARGTALSIEMFAMAPKDVFRLLRGPKDPANLQKVAQFHHQSRSIVEYLCGESAPRDMRSALGAFLRDARSKADPEGSFRLHSGQGFGPLLDGWRQWVLDQEIGAYETPPDRIRDGLLERVLPAIRDRRAKRGDRLVAIGEWVNAGFVLGADALIDLLRDPGDLPKEHIVWALCMVSGNAWGDEPDRWQTWWDDLPSAWEEPPEPATERPSDGLAIGLGAGTPADTTAEAPGDRSPREEETGDALLGDIPTGDIGLIRRP